eukprot:GHVQ01024933.1.p1 GENE.GHVQ01024933.1~~GHVQ01024933.1.p1  ORF type:complete len:134 (-),score=8.20 GHVQ01024933.1:980-1381(-)
MSLYSIQQKIMEFVLTYLVPTYSNTPVSRFPRGDTLFLVVVCYILLSVSTNTVIGFPSKTVPFFGPKFSGTCIAGTRYTITSLEQLEGSADDYDCILNAGFAPDVVPLGPAAGKLLLLFNSRKFGGSNSTFSY